jgi:non-heme chloroperoxidase
LGKRRFFRKHPIQEVIMDSATQPQPIAIDGAELHYVMQGEGEPVVLVHGSLGDYRTWANQLPVLAERYRVVAYSRRFHFPSQGDETAGDYTVAQHAADLAALIEGLDLGPVHLVAESYGASVALLCAHHYPHLVRSLVIGEPPLVHWLADLPGGAELLEDYLDGVIRPAQAACRAGDAEEAVEHFFDGNIGREGAFAQLPPPVREPLLDNAPALLLDLLAATAAMEDGDDYFGPLTPERAADIACPTLLLAGGRSPELFRLITDALATRLPAASLTTIPRAAHAMAAGQPKAYNRAVLDFLAAA